MRAFYLDTLDLNATLQKGNQLKENRTRIKAEEEKKAAESKSVVKEILTTEIHVDLGRKPDVSKSNEPVATFRLEVTATASKLMALRKFIDDNGITYKKI